MNSIKLYGNGSATANAVAQVIIPSKSRLRGIQISAFWDGVTDGGFSRLEVSRASASEIAVNGAQQCICEVGTTSNFVTSGMDKFSVCTFFPLDVPVIQGQIIYLHSLVAGTITYLFAGIIWYD